MDVAPNRVGPYDVRGQLGRGGMGVVLRAVAPGGAEVAVKLMNDASRTNALARFDRERRLLGDLGDARGFVPLLDAGEHDGRPFIVMPLVPGGTLRARLGQGPLSVDETLTLGHALATAVGEAHARGIVHRDLKPENVLFTGDGRVLVADLGLAKHFSDGNPSRSVALSRSGDVLGTAGYAAPEQFLAGGEASPAQDVFALGAILYECLSGEAAFVGGSLFELVAKVDRGDYVPLSVAAPTVSRALARVVERALARDPAARFPDGASLARALEVARATPPARGRPLLRSRRSSWSFLRWQSPRPAARRGPRWIARGRAIRRRS